MSLLTQHPFEDTQLMFFCDPDRHLVCTPYSKENLHQMAEELGIKRCWFHRDHYDIPLRRIAEVAEKCSVITPRQVVNIIFFGHV